MELKCLSLGLTSKQAQSFWLFLSYIEHLQPINKQKTLQCVEINLSSIYEEKKKDESGDLSILDNEI